MPTLIEPAVASGALRTRDQPTLDGSGLVVRHSVVNAASCRVAAKAGYPLEGTRRESVRHLDGWHSMHVHVRIAGDAVR